MADNTRQIETTHKEYEKYSADWQLFFDSYNGEGGFRDGTYLTAHPLEKDDAGNESASFVQRKAVAWYVNYPAFIIDAKHSHLFKRPIARSTKDKELQFFIENCDGKGTKYGDYLKDIQQDAQIAGHIFVFMDRPSSTELKAKSVVTKADEMAAGVRPYIYACTPQEVIDWAHDRRGNFEWIKVREVHTVYDGYPLGVTNPMAKREEKDYIRVWTREETILFDMEGTAVERDAHNLGIVPCVILYNKMGKKGELSGTSEIAKIAPVNRRLYNALSELDEWLRNQAFSILTIPLLPEDEIPKDADGNPLIGVATNRALTYNGASPKAPGFIGADAAHAGAYETRISALIEDIYRLAHMKFKGGVVQSGTSWAFDWEEVNMALMAQAALLRDADSKIVRMWHVWQNKPTDKMDYHAEYPETYSFSDEETELAMLRDFSLTEMPSLEFMRAFYKNRIRRLLPNLTKEQLDKIDTEIDTWDGPVQDEPATPESNFDRFTEGTIKSERKRNMDGSEKPGSQSSGKDNSGQTINPSK